MTSAALRPPVTSSLATVVVPVTTMWVTPASPRDSAIVADQPDAPSWLATLDAHADHGCGRLGLHGRVESQLVEGEPVHVVSLDTSGRWAEVLAPWQVAPTAWRHLGVVVPRDADAQGAAAAPVDVDDVQPGDLYFARSGRPIHHVGIVTAPGRMVHASETGGLIVEEDLPAARRSTLVAAGRRARGVALQ